MVCPFGVVVIEEGEGEDDIRNETGKSLLNYRRLTSF